MAALLTNTLSLFMLFIFLRALLHKVSDFTEFQGFVADYRLLPHTLVTPASVLLLVLEALIVIGLLFNPSRAFALYLAAALLSLYAAAMGVNLLRGRTRVECGCGGIPQPLHHSLVLRNAILVIAALTAVAWLQPLSGLDQAAVVFPAALVTLLLFVLLEQINSNRLRIPPPSRLS
ncbi:Methylamine utilization protein MauE [Alloalcanivorax dieselolei B5]|uniref:Methylamine utilization protein MauE n=1 Tax=Alcanivorax dieselolei (strain DSM 16502 / CGMCC 1.3690 / MCCC 1A00001 / B-5) TaxID=930169 RepID=K0CAH4_ALCDB|nr:MauE/DoxX family redox-associated membrane protein [Alloalcanivorax dieselolei]AFT68451.1 Methylamine utilization protein MauE [Alloalcanivorax dieselolei B5]GGJ99575.1 hypothetical protein GCM10007426_30870 [Alloalcanivorax dieselolei]